MHYLNAHKLMTNLPVVRAYFAKRGEPRADFRIFMQGRAQSGAAGRARRSPLVAPRRGPVDIGGDEKYLVRIAREKQYRTADIVLRRLRPRRNSSFWSAQAPGSASKPGLVGKAEDVGIVEDAARRLHAADHGEMVLVAVQPGQEDDAGLVVLRSAPRRSCATAARSAPSARDSRRVSPSASCAERGIGDRRDRRRKCRAAHARCRLPSPAISSA